MIKFLYKFPSNPIWLNNSSINHSFIFNRCIFSRIFITESISDFQIKRLLFQQCLNKIDNNKLISTPLSNFNNNNRKYFSVIKTKIVPLDDDSDSVTISPVVDVDRNKSIPSLVPAEINKCNEQKFNELSGEFAQSINNTTVWKDVPPLKFSNLINDYSKLSKIKLTGSNLLN